MSSMAIAVNCFEINPTSTTERGESGTLGRREWNWLETVPIACSIPLHA
jgi:hypothetical protein